jgi:hypothetical protein
MLSRLGSRRRKESRSRLFRATAGTTDTTTQAWNLRTFHVMIRSGGNEEEEQAMSAIFEYFTLFDFFIVAALIGIFCCGLLDGEKI